MRATIEIEVVGKAADAMPMLKTLWGVTRIAGRIESYLMVGRKIEKARGAEKELGEQSRALDVDLVNIWQRQNQSWGEAMDAVRALDEAGRKRKYMHVVISPDPEDDITLEQLKEIANAWVQEFFGYDSPRICPAQAAIVYHDDNEREIKHAHIVVNNMDLSDDGGAINVDAKQWRAMTDRLQELARERGLHSFDEHGISQPAAPSINSRRVERRFDAAPPTRQTMTEIKMEQEHRRGSWKQEIKNAIEVACQMSDSPEQVVMHLAQMGIVAEPRTAKRVRPGEDFIFYYPQAGVPLEQNKKRVSGERLGKRYTAAGMRAQIRVSHYRKIYAEDKDAVALLDMLVDVRDVEVQRGQTLADLAAAFAAINNFQITNMQDAQRHLAVLRERVKRELAAGNPVRMESDQIKQLEALIRIGPASNLVPLLREQSRTAQAAVPKVDREQHAREARGEKIPLKEKVARGYRLTKSEYEQLRRHPRDFHQWQDNRKFATTGRKPAGGAGGGSSSGSSHGAAPSQVRSRGSRSR